MLNPSQHGGYTRAKEWTEMMHQRRLGTTLASKITIKSKTKNDCGKPSERSLRVEDKIRKMLYKRCTLRIQAKRKTILKRTLKAE